MSSNWKPRAMFMKARMPNYLVEIMIPTNQSSQSTNQTSKTKDLKNQDLNFSASKVEVMRGVRGHVGQNVNKPTKIMADELDPDYAMTTKEVQLKNDGARNIKEMDVIIVP